MTRFFPMVLGLALVPLAACPPEVACTEIAVTSVNVQVDDADGVAIEGATVSYTVDGGDSAACSENSGGSYSCGVEEPGEIEVTAVADGFGEASDSVTIVMDEDDCHVVPQDITLSLPIED